MMINEEPIGLRASSSTEGLRTPNVADSIQVPEHRSGAQPSWRRPLVTRFSLERTLCGGGSLADDCASQISL